MASEHLQNRGSELQTLSLDFPEVLVCDGGDTFADFKHSVGVVASDGAEHVERVDSDVDPLVGQADQGVVQEHVEPLFVEGRLLIQHVGLAAIDQLVLPKVLLEALHNLDSE